ncbi:hypothetical protein [Williamsia sp. 1135]|uniref:hypothetical protein n=1 Tax=Williamsia sp. 1135 TaxID=1889262 RepID=UPI000A11269C|nr:hypothetical protein [Williamsia sp. 1135]ORM35511.1 hypothetical protein BFL43_09325 [Williamsia sp. 1135]
MSFTTPEFRRPPAGGPSRTALVLVAVLAVLLALIVATIVVISQRDTNDDDGSGTSTATVTQAPSTAITWQVVGRAELPFSEAAGPRELDGVSAYGFAHTEIGAVLAAWQIALRLSVLSGTDDIYERQVVGDREAVDAFRVSVADLQASMEPDQRLPRVVAWRPARPYSDYAASTDFAVPTDSDDAVTVIRFSVVWIGGDWKLQPGLYGDAPADDVPRAEISAEGGWHLFEGALQ